MDLFSRNETTPFHRLASPHDVEILTVHYGRAGKTYRSFIAIGILSRPGVFPLERDRLRRTVYRQIAGHPAARTTKKFNLAALKGDCGVLGFIEEVVGKKVLVSFFDPGIHAGNVNINLY